RLRASDSAAPSSIKGRKFPPPWGLTSRDINAKRGVARASIEGQKVNTRQAGARCINFISE
ncbi:MAG: hypothetical protein ACRET3_02955, partial [Burkholderiales bacterium]